MTDGTAERKIPEPYPQHLNLPPFSERGGANGPAMASNVSLAALYRPQTFAEVVGQDMVKSILSRAAREDRVAPAYLLSGTRGVGLFLFTLYGTPFGMT